MTVLKWLVTLALAGYLVGLAVLFFVQRSFLFPIPQKMRTAPKRPASRRLKSSF